MTTPRLPAPTAAATRRRLAALLALSGAAGLTLEVVWARQLALLLGSSVAAHATVVAAFMGGLALGYAWGGRRAAGWRRPLAVYGSLELFVGLWAAATPALLAVARGATLAALGRWGAGSAAAATAQVVVAAAFLLPPTFAMGATLPTLTALLARHEPRRAATSVALLYAWNSAGAAAGALVAGLLLLTHLGLAGTTWAAAGLEVSLAGASLLWARRAPAAPGQGRGAETDATDDATGTPSHGALLVADATALLGGLASMALQGLWFRLFGLLLGSSSDAFTVVLGTFIASVAVGAGLARRARAPALVAVAVAAAAGAAILLATGPLYEHGPYWIGSLKAHALDAGWSFTAFAAARAGLVAALVVGPATAFGALLPLAARLASGAPRRRLLRGPALDPPRGRRRAARPGMWMVARRGGARPPRPAARLLAPHVDVAPPAPRSARQAAAGGGGRAGAGAGRAFALNTVGAVLGAGLGVPVLVPAVGLGWVFAGVALVLTALAAGAAWVWRREARRRQEASLRRPNEWIAWVALGAMWVAFMGATLPRWDPRVLSAGAFRGRGLRDASFEAFRARVGRSRVVFHRDGPSATVAVLERHGERVLTVDGKPDASTRGDMVTQVASAHLPLLLHRGPRRALVIGLGSGVTAGSAALHAAATPSGRLAVDVVELSSAVVEASHSFDEVSGAPLGRRQAGGHGTGGPGPTDRPGGDGVPRDVRLILDDARSALLAAQAGGKRWDVIISEPSNPWVAGNASLFTREMFQLMRGRLRPGGVLAQWIQLYETDDEALRLVVRTLRAVFPKVTAWVLYPTDLLLVAGDERWRPDLHRLAARASQPAIAADLRRVGIAGAAGLLSLQALGPRGVDELLRGGGQASGGPAGLVHTDDRPWLEFAAPRWLFRAGRAEVVRRLDARGTRGPAGGDARWRERWGTIYARAHPPTLATLEGLFTFHTRYPGAPPSYRTERLLPRILAAGAGTDTGPHAEAGAGWASFVTDVVFTMAREGRWEAFGRASRALLGRPAVAARGLYAVAWGRVEALEARQAPREAGAGHGAPRRDADEPPPPRGAALDAAAPGGWVGVERLLNRCLALGDEPRGRCARLQGALRRRGLVR